MYFLENIYINSPEIYCLHLWKFLGKRWILSWQRCELPACVQCLTVFCGGVLQLKCGACGNQGHMRTNKECPLYNKSSNAAPIPVAVTEEQEEEIEQELNLVDQDLINVEGTTLKISKQVIERSVWNNRVCVKGDQTEIHRSPSNEVMRQGQWHEKLHWFKAFVSGISSE